jgi:hypothetical protein
MLSACALVSLCLRIPVADAQHAGHGGSAHVSGGAHIAVPRSAPAPAAHAAVARPHLSAPGPRGFHFQQAPLVRFRRAHFVGGRFLGPAFFRFGPDWQWTYPWEPGCGLFWNGAPVCYNSPLYGFGFENYVTVEPYETPAYLYEYERAEGDLVWLFRKDGTVYSVTDYWFVNNEVHFRTFDNDGARSERVMPQDDLDLSRTVEVNTSRGFRVVKRDQPLEEYLRDHPDATPPAAVPPPAS